MLTFRHVTGEARDHHRHRHRLAATGIAASRRFVRHSPLGRCPNPRGVWRPGRLDCRCSLGAHAKNDLLTSAEQVADTDPSSAGRVGQYTDVSQVEKFELPEEEYAKRNG